MRRPILSALTLLLAVVLIGCGDPEAVGGETTRPSLADDDTVELTFRVDAEDATAFDESVQTLRSRLDALDLDGAEVDSDRDEVSVRVPREVEDLVRATFLVGGRLEFRPVLAPTSDAPGSAAEGDEAAEVVLATADGEAYLLGPVAFGGEGVETASANQSPQGMWVVDLVLRDGPEGIERFNELAAQCYAGQPTCPPAGAPQGQLAIVLDGVVLSAPTINVPSFERDQIQISGDFDESSAQALAVALRSGALPGDVVEAD